MNDSSAKLLEFIRNTLCSQELILANEFLLFSEQSWKPIFLACIRMQVQLLLWLNFYRKLLTWIVARMENCCDWRKHSCNPVRISPKWDPVSSPGPQRAAATIHSEWDTPLHEKTLKFTLFVGPLLRANNGAWADTPTPRGPSSPFKMRQRHPTWVFHLSWGEFFIGMHPHSLSVCLPSVNIVLQIVVV